MSRRHHRLTERSQAAGVDLPVTWDKYLCALVAEHKTPKDVLQCIGDLDLFSVGSKARHLAPRLSVHSGHRPRQAGRGGGRPS